MRWIFLIGVVLLGFMFPWWAFFVVAALYMVRYTAYELIALGILLDVSFGIHLYSIPFPCFYTGALSLFLMATLLAKPLMTFTTTRSSRT